MQGLQAGREVIISGRWRQVILWVLGAIGIAMFFFPPTVDVAAQESFGESVGGRGSWSGYRFLLGNDMFGHMTDWTRLLVQYAILASVAWFVAGGKDGLRRA